jgi:hypothetical protein
MTRVFYVVGSFGVLAGVAQHLSTVRKIEFSAWPSPFVPREDARAWQFVNAAGMALISLAVLALGVITVRLVAMTHALLQRSRDICCARLCQ